MFIVITYFNPQILEAQAIWLRDTDGQALRADPSHVPPSVRSCYAYIRFYSPLSFNRRLRPDVIAARPTRRRGRLSTELSALQHRADGREHLSHLSRRGRF